MSLRSPMGRVLGHGAAKAGPAHWWMQRMTAIALVLLGLWFSVQILLLGSFEHGVVLAWISEPLNTVLLALLVLAAVYHSQLGLQVVIEDYVHGSARVVTLVLVNFLHIVVGALGVFAVLRIAFGVGR